MLNCWLAVCLSVIRSEALCGSLRGRFKAPSWSVPAAPVLSPNWQVQPLFGCRNHYAVSLNSHHFCLVRQCQRTEGEKKNSTVVADVEEIICWLLCHGGSTLFEPRSMIEEVSWPVRRMRGDCRRKFSLVLFPDKIQNDWDSCPWLLAFTELTVWDLSLELWALYLFWSFGIFQCAHELFIVFNPAKCLPQIQNHSKHIVIHGKKKDTF